MKISLRMSNIDFLYLKKMFGAPSFCMKDEMIMEKLKNDGVFSLLGSLKYIEFKKYANRV